jgi:PD-(D/E)XK nuclease superfamily
VEKLAPGAPRGVIQHGERWVESRPLVLPACSSCCFIRGKFDTAARLDDQSHGIFDFKTCERKAEHLPLYARQLHAYAHAVEHPAPGRLSLSPVSTLGLLVFEPSRFDHGASGEVALEASLTWIEIPRDDEWFLDFLSGVVSVLEQPFPPDAAPSCEWCLFRETSRRTGF